MNRIATGADFGSRAGLAAASVGQIEAIVGVGADAMLDHSDIALLGRHEDPVVAMAGQIGSHVKMPIGDRWVVGTVRSLRVAGATIAAKIDMIGEAMRTDEGELIRFQRGVTRFPLPGCPVHAVSTEDMEMMFGEGKAAQIEIGTIHPTASIRAKLRIDAMLGKHFALVGSTGTGKSTAAALILHRICRAAPAGHIVMIDPHGEYGAAFGTSGAVFDVSNLAMPYWLMNFEEHCEVFLTATGPERHIDADILAKCLLMARQKNRLAEQVGRITQDSPIPYLLSDLCNILQNEMGKLDKGHSSIPYMRVKSKIEEIRNDPRYQFMFSGMLVSDTMAEFVGRLFRLPAHGKPISIIDVSGVPSEITSTVVAVLSRLVFDYAIWSRQEATRPILLVCEEAHRYVPNERNSDGSSVGRILSRIAKEGRKYGVSLGLITQRPSDLAEGVLSQCGTIISMRLNNDRDQQFVRAAMPEGARGFLDAIPALRNRECIICGEGVAIPIRVAFDDLAEARRPASADPSFSELWGKSGGEEDSVGRTVHRWRAQSRF